MSAQMHHTHFWMELKTNCRGEHYVNAILDALSAIRASLNSAETQDEIGALDREREMMEGFLRADKRLFILPGSLVSSSTSSHFNQMMGSDDVEIETDPVIEKFLKKANEENISWIDFSLNLNGEFHDSIIADEKAMQKVAPNVDLDTIPALHPKQITGYVATSVGQIAKASSEPSQA